MSSSFWLLALGSRDLSQAEKEIIDCYAEQINSQIDKYFHLNRQPRTILSENICNFGNLLSLAHNCFFLSLR